MGTKETLDDAVTLLDAIRDAAEDGRITPAEVLGIGAKLIEATANLDVKLKRTPEGLRRKAKRLRRKARQLSREADELEAKG